MDPISKIISDIESGKRDLRTTLEMLNLRNSQNEHINLDLSRESRCGFPEFIYGENKTVDQLLSITAKLAKIKTPVLITRISNESADVLKTKYINAIHDKDASVFLLLPENFHTNKGNVVIVTAGTTDIPVALEAKYTLTACGCKTTLIADSGVAGIDRILSKKEKLNSADVIIVVAGMEGALPSVVGGLVSVPVIALPTSVGYGTALNGLTAFFSMLNSCANGVTVVNIDNGFGAGCAAARIINSKQ